MNLAFVAAGAVSPSAFYLVIQGALALWYAERKPLGRPAVCLLIAAAAAGSALAALSIPFVSTLHPHGIVEDPAVMMLTVGALTVAGCALVLRGAMPAGEAVDRSESRPAEAISRRQ